MDKKEFVALEVGNLAVILSGAAGVALAIIGLAGIYPVILMGAAAIAIGASFTIAGIAIAAEKRKILAESTGGTLTSPGMFTFGHRYGVNCWNHFYSIRYIGTFGYSSYNLTWRRCYSPWTRSFANE